MINEIKSAFGMPRNIEQDLIIKLKNKDADFVELKFIINNFNYVADCYSNSVYFNNLKKALAEKQYKKLCNEKQISLKAIIELRCVEKLLGTKSTEIKVNLIINDFNNLLFSIKQKDNYFFIRELCKKFNNTKNLNNWFFKSFNFYIEEELLDELNSLVIKNKFLGI